MAGERLPKLTLRAAWSRYDDGLRGEQTRQVRLRLNGAWFTFERGAYPYLRQFSVPDPDDVQEEYMKQGAANFIAAVRLCLQQTGLAYVVSEGRDSGPNAAGDLQVDFDIEGTTYAVGNLDFENSYTGTPNGWQVRANLPAITPVKVLSRVTPALVAGTKTGAIYLSAFEGVTGRYTYTWTDIGPGPDAREELAAGFYTCTVADESGASTTVRLEVKSDPRLVVQVAQTDTSITLTVSGGFPAYIYAWDDGPTTAARTGLDLGSTYACLVTDAHGASQRVVITLEVYRYYWSQNPARFPLDAGDDYRADPTTKPNLSFLAEVWVEPVYLSGEFVQVGPQLEQPADALGRTEFEVSALLDAFLSEHLPPLVGPVVERADVLFRRFYLKTGEKHGTPPEPAPLLAAEQQYVLLGGLSEEEAAAGGWFAYQAAVKPFLTWEPDYQRVLPTQPVYLYYQHLGAGATCQLWRRVQQADGSSDAAEQLASFGDVRRLEVFCLRVGEGVAPTAVGYEVWVSDEAGVVLSQVRHYVLDRTYYAQQRFFLYTNSLGGLNVLAATGQTKHTLEVKANEAPRPGFDAQLGDTLVLDRTGAPTLAITSGARRRAQVVADQDLLLAHRVTLLRDGYYWPGRIKPATFVVKDEGEGLASVNFEYLLPTQRRFSPRLPAVASGQQVRAVAGGEGAQP